MAAMVRSVAWILGLVVAAWPLRAAEPEIVVPQGREGLDPVVLELLESSIRAARGAPEDAGARGRLCMAYEANLLWPEAASCYQGVAALAPDEVVWPFHEALAWLEIGEIDTARVLLEDVVEAAPDLWPGVQRLAYLELESGQLESSLELFERLIDGLPDRAAGYLGAGEIDLLAGDIESAVEHLDKAVALDPSSEGAHYQLGLAYRGAGRVEEARRELALGEGGRRRYLPDPLAAEVVGYSVHVTALIERAGQFLEAGRDAEAAEVLEDLLRRTPENPTVLNDLAVAYMRQGQLDEARSILERSLALDRDSFGTYLNLSAWASYAGLADEAQSYARSAVEIAPGVAVTHLALARVLGDPRFTAASAGVVAARDEMFTEFQRAIELGVDTPDAYLQLARERWQDEDVEMALAALAAALERWPDFWPGELMSTWILVRAGRLEEGEERLERVRALAPQHPDLATLERMIAEALAESQAESGD